MSGLTHEECNVALTLAANSTASAVKASAGVLVGWQIHNTTGAAVYVKLYNKAAGSVNPASDTPAMVIGMAAGASSNLTIPNGIYFSAAISVRCVTEIGHTGTTAPSASTVAINLIYK